MQFGQLGEKIDDTLTPTSKSMESQKAWTRKHIHQMTYNEKDIDIELE